MSDQVSDYISDPNIFCPSCGGIGAEYLEIPEHRREWTDIGTGHVHVHFMPKTLDYLCPNCEQEWSMADGVQS